MQNVQKKSFHLRKTLLLYGRYNLEQWCFNTLISYDFHDLMLIRKCTRNSIFLCRKLWSLKMLYKPKICEALTATCNEMVVHSINLVGFNTNIPMPPKSFSTDGIVFLKVTLNHFMTVVNNKHQRKFSPQLSLVISCVSTTMIVLAAKTMPVIRASITVTSEWVRWRLKSPATRLLTQLFI